MSTPGVWPTVGKYLALLPPFRGSIARGGEESNIGDRKFQQPTTGLEIFFFPRRGRGWAAPDNEVIRGKRGGSSVLGSSFFTGGGESRGVFDVVRREAFRVIFEQPPKGSLGRPERRFSSNVYILPLIRLRGSLEREVRGPVPRGRISSVRFLFHSFRKSRSFR